MNKKAALIASALLLTSYSASADVLGVYVGGQVWELSADGAFGEKNDLQNYDFSDDTEYRFYIALEHPIPLIPNVKLVRNKLNTEGVGAVETDAFRVENVFSQVDLTYTDYTFYYEIFDNDLVSIDLGITAKDFSGDFDSGLNIDDIDEAIPMAYASAQVGLPFTGLSLIAEGNFLAIDDSNFTEYQIGIAYELIDNMLIDVNLQAGYRRVDLELDDVDDVYSDINFDGLFAGVEIHF
ncbi:TIGR04219 family outer membrane beta-barrel protein [Thalassotalea aquiviva]|uniref:TIGR04219 family outer membrane beta-barrel protein n=1 Tax=Thalassotalea aquiviva TaxID=3242415 RepID=UPI00352A903B